MEKQNNKTLFTEDIWAVLIGSILLADVLVAAFALPGFKFTTPKQG